MNLLRRLWWNPPIVRVPDKLDTSEGDTPVATEFAKMTSALRDEMDAEKWRRAKDYIEAQIAAHQKAIDVGGLSFEGFHTHMLKRDTYKQVLEAAENNVPDANGESP